MSGSAFEGQCRSAENWRRLVTLLDLRAVPKPKSRCTTETGKVHTRELKPMHLGTKITPPVISPYPTEFIAGSKIWTRSKICTILQLVLILKPGLKFARENKKRHTHLNLRTVPGTVGSPTTCWVAPVAYSMNWREGVLQIKGEACSDSCTFKKYSEYCIYFFNLGRREGTGWVELSARASSCWVLWQLRYFGEEEKRGLHPTLCRCR
jgi:hypothetical protein